LFGGNAIFILFVKVRNNISSLYKVNVCVYTETVTNRNIVNIKYLETTNASDPAILHYKVLEKMQNNKQLNV